MGRAGAEGAERVGAFAWGCAGLLVDTSGSALERERPTAVVERNEGAVRSERRTSDNSLSKSLASELRSSHRAGAKLASGEGRAFSSLPIGKPPFPRSSSFTGEHRASCLLSFDYHSQGKSSDHRSKLMSKVF